MTRNPALDALTRQQRWPEIAPAAVDAEWATEMRFPARVHGPPETHAIPAIGDCRHLGLVNMSSHTRADLFRGAPGPGSLALRCGPGSALTIPAVGGPTDHTLVLTPLGAAWPVAAAAPLADTQTVTVFLSRERIVDPWLAPAPGIVSPARTAWHSVSPYISPWIATDGASAVVLSVLVSEAPGTGASLTIECHALTESGVSVDIGAFAPLTAGQLPRMYMIGQGLSSSLGGAVDVLALAPPPLMRFVFSHSVTGTWRYDTSIHVLRR